MPIRRLLDASGVEWEVWEVHPTMAERREMRERRTTARNTPDRRVRPQIRAVIPISFRKGWLAFRSRTEHRRRAPIPPDWESMADDELRNVLESAERSTGPRRRLIE